MSRILIIDDDSASATALLVLLEDHRCEVRVELNSPRAVDAAREFEPDVILIDYMMPKAHGGDVAWQLSACPDLTEVKLIIYSALLPNQIRSKLPPREIPILQKPVSVEQLLGLLENCGRI